MGNQTSSSADSVIDTLEVGLRETHRQTPRVLDSAGRTMGHYWDKVTPEPVRSMPGNAANNAIDAMGRVPKKWDAQQQSWNRSIDRLPQNTKTRVDNVVASIGPAADYVRETSDFVRGYVTESWDNLPEETKETLKEAPQRTFSFCSAIPRRTERMAKKIYGCGLNPCYEAPSYRVSTKSELTYHLSHGDEVGYDGDDPVHYESERTRASGSNSQAQASGSSSRERRDQSYHNHQNSNEYGGSHSHRSGSDAAEERDGMSQHDEYGGSHTSGSQQQQGKHQSDGHPSSSPNGNSIFDPNNRFSRLSKVIGSPLSKNKKLSSKSRGDGREGSIFRSQFSGSSGSAPQVIEGGSFTQEDIFRMIDGGNSGKYGIHSMVFNQSNVTMNKPVLMSRRKLGGSEPSDDASSAYSSSYGGTTDESTISSHR